MKDSFSKKADAFLQAENYDLGLVLAKIKELQILNEKIRAYLDPSLAPYCQVANRLGNRLILLVANGSIATQLRFQLPELVKKLKTDTDMRLQKIQDIQCKVHPGFSAPRLAKTRKRPDMALLSPETAKIVGELADSIEDPRLREIMKKIARQQSTS